MSLEVEKVHQISWNHLEGISHQVDQKVKEISFKNFKSLYQQFSPNQWINDLDLLFETTNQIARQKPEFFDLAIRLNVQVNLFLRTLYTFGSPEQIKKYQGKIGSFALTESEAGVLSGLVVETTFTQKNDHYILNTNQIHKNWISQGFYAETILVYAQNISDPKDIRIFLVPVESPNLEIKIKKTSVVPGLDLTEIRITNLKLDLDAVLEKSISAKKFTLLNGIFYGRLLIAESNLNGLLGLLEYCYEIIQKNPKFLKLDHHQYVSDQTLIINNLNQKMRQNRHQLLKNQDVDRINAYKIYTSHLAIQTFVKLQTLFGSRLFAYPIKLEDIIINKIAEGDTDILRLALIRSQIKKGFWKILYDGTISWYNLLQGSWNHEYIFRNYHYISDQIIKKLLKTY